MKLLHIGFIQILFIIFVNKFINANFGLNGFHLTPQQEFLLQKRHKNLQKIVDQNGSMQSDDVLTYAESWWIHSVPTVNARPYKAAYDRLIDAIQSFTDEYAELRVAKVDFKQIFVNLEKETVGKPTVHEMLMSGKATKIRMEFVGELRKHKPAHNLILRCKQFIRARFTEGGEADWLDIFSFMLIGHEQKQFVYQLYLENIYELSKIQSEDLDQLLLAEIYSEHLETARSSVHTVDRTQYKQALVVGAGPIGLYSGLQMFLAGLEVVIINDRPENYVRAQTFFLDKKWMVQLRFFLGRAFDQLFFGEQAKGVIHGLEQGMLKCRLLEDALKNRMVELVSFVQHQEELAVKYNPFVAKIEKNSNGKIEVNRPLDILFEVTFVGHKERQDGGFYAILEVPDKANPNQGEFNANLIELEVKKLRQNDPEAGKASGELRQSVKAKRIQQRLKQIRAHKSSKGIQQLQRTIGNGLAQEQLSSLERAELELRGKAMELRQLPDVAFDLLVCTGGANDRIRNKYIGIPEKFATFHYGVSVLQKAVFGHNIFGEGVSQIQEDIEIGQLRPFLQQYADSFQQSIKSLNSSWLTEKYKNFLEMILTMNAENKQQLVWLLETKDSIYMAPSTPSGIVALFADFEKLKEQEIAAHQIMDALGKRFTVERKKEMNQKLVDSLDQIKEARQQIERNWFMAILSYCYTLNQANMQIELNIDVSGRILHTFEQWKSTKEVLKNQHQKLFFDVPNTATFPLEVKGLANGAAEIRHGTSTKPGLAIALGDSLATPHFMTGSGLSTGRLGVEKAANTIRQYKLENNMSNQQFLQILRANLSAVKEIAKQKAFQVEQGRLDSAEYQRSSNNPFLA